MKQFELLKLPLHFWRAYLAVALQAYSVSAIYFLSLYLTTQLHYSILQAGFAVTLFGFGTFLGSIISPILTRILNEERVVLVLLIAMGIIFLILAHIKLLLGINILVLIYGIFAYAFIPANQVSVLKKVPMEHRLYANNVWRVSKNVLTSLGFLVNGLLAQFSFPHMLMITALIIFIGVTIIFIVPQKSPSALSDIDFEGLDKVVKKPFRNLHLYAIYFTVFLVGLIYSQLNSNYPIYLHKIYDISSQGYGFLFAINTWFVIILQIPIMHWLSRYQHKYIVAVGGLCMGLGLVVLTFGHSWALAIISCLIWSSGEVLFFSLSEVMVINYAGNHTKVLFMSLFQFIYAIGAMLGPLGGSVIFHYQSGEWLWYACGIAGILVFLILIRLRMATKL